MAFVHLQEDKTKQILELLIFSGRDPSVPARLLVELPFALKMDFTVTMIYPTATA